MIDVMACRLHLVLLSILLKGKGSFDIAYKLVESKCGVAMTLLHIRLYHVPSLSSFETRIAHYMNI